MSSGHERDRATFQSNSADAPPSRARPSHANGNPHGYPAIREIHKNAWLKRLSPGDKKPATFIRKYEKHWVVFCVHDDVEAFLEFYTEPKQGAGHKPAFAVSLNSCLHVSPSIMGQDNEYEFAVTLPTQVIRLIAANWEQMIEWVESLQGKLREMNILCPKDNVYSKLPENQSTPCQLVAQNRTGHNALVTTRDPNSPLPPPPSRSVTTSRRTEHVRPLQASARNESVPSGSSSGESSTQNPTSQSKACSGGKHRKKHSPVSTSTSTGSDQSTDNLLRESDEPSGLRLVQVCEPNDLRSSHGVRVQANEHTMVHTLNRPLQEISAETVAVICANNTVKIGSECSNSAIVPSVSVIVNSNPVVSATSVVQVSFPDAGTSSQSCSVIHHGTNNIVSTTATPTSNNQTVSSLAHSVKPQTPATATSHIIQLKLDSKTPENVSCNNVEEAPLIQIQHLSESSAMSNSHTSPSPENVYEHLFIPPSVSNPVSGASANKLNTSGACTKTLSDPGCVTAVPPIIPRRNPKRHNKNSRHESSSLSADETEEAIATKMENRLNIGMQRGNGERKQSSRNADIIRRVDSCPTPTDAPCSSSRATHTEQCRPMEAMIGVRSGEYRIRRDDAHCPVSNVHVDGARGDGEHHNRATHLPLKEQQVLRLKAEIHHAGGVRIVLRKKDCVSSIALVDYLGAVWIAGWKQVQHPVLYYAFHVGDQVIKVAGVTVQNSAEAHRAIKMVSSMQVEFIIRRLPYGRVLVLKRNKEGEPLGLISEGNSGEIGEVVSNGLAASHGLPSRGPSADGNSSCNWFLTEINNRPLNLMARESEVKERLNAVGKEISILVQPADLVKHLRKQLKAMKGFKDYLIV